MIRTFAAIAASAAFCFGAANAAVQTIDFDELANSTFVDTQYAAQGAIFSSTGGGVRVFTFAGADSQPNTIGGTNASGDLDFSQQIEITFMTGGMAATTDFVSVAFTDLQLTGNFMAAYDINGNLIAQVEAPCAADFSCNLIETVTIAASGIHRIVLEGAGNRGQADVAFDTVMFNDVMMAGDPVPLPGAALLFATGLAGLGARRRMKKSS